MLTIRFGILMDCVNSSDTLFKAPIDPLLLQSDNLASINLSCILNGLWAL